MGVLGSMVVGSLIGISAMMCLAAMLTGHAACSGKARPDRYSPAKGANKAGPLVVHPAEMTRAHAERRAQRAAVGEKIGRVLGPRGAVTFCGRNLLGRVDVVG